MKKVLALIISAISIQLGAQPIDAQKYSISFEVSNTAFNTVEGSLKGMTGKVVFDNNQLESSLFDVCLDAATIDTGNDKRDEHLRKDDFFDVEKYPTICFMSDKVIKSGNSYKAVGRLTMHGVTNDVEIPFKLKDKVLIGEMTLIRQDYGVGSNSLLVGDDVKITMKFYLN